MSVEHGAQYGRRMFGRVLQALPALLALLTLAVGLRLSWLGAEREVQRAAQALEDGAQAAMQEHISRIQDDLEAAAGLARTLAAGVPATASASERTAVLDAAGLERGRLPVVGAALLYPGEPAHTAAYRTWGSWGPARELWWPLAAAAMQAGQEGLFGLEGNTAPGGQAVLVAGAAGRARAVLVLDLKALVERRAAAASHAVGVRLSEAGEDNRLSARARSAQFDDDAALGQAGAFRLGTRNWLIEITSAEAVPGPAAFREAFWPGALASAMLALLVGVLTSRWRLSAVQAARSSRLYERAIAATDDGIWVLPRATAHFRLSDTAVRLLGLPTSGREQRIGWFTALRRVAREDRLAVLRAVRALVRDNAALDIECRVATATSGRWVRLRARASADAEIVGAISDTAATHRAAERQQRASDFLQRLIDLIPDAVGVRDAQRRVVICNPAYAAMLGQAPADPRGRDLLDFVPEDQRTDCVAGSASLLAGGAQSQLVTLPGPDGRPRRWRINRLGARDPDGAPVILAVGTDLTELLDAQAAEHEALGRVDSLYRGAPFGLVLMDAGGRFRQANPAFCSLVGYSEAELCRRDYASIMPARWAEADRQLRGELGGAGVTRPHERSVLTAAGDEVPVRVTAIAMPAAEGERWVWGVVEDLREEVAARQALAAAEARWQFALLGSGDGVWDWDITTGRVYFSPRWKAMLGHADDEIGEQAEEWSERIHPDEREQVLGAVESLLGNAAEKFEVTCRMRHKQGHWVWVLDRAAVVARAPDGTPLRVVGTHTDITRQVAERAELERKRDLLETIRRIQQGFIRGAGNEQGFARILERILSFTDSRFGFVGEVLVDDGQPWLKTFAISNIAWSEETRRFYAERAPLGIQFRNLDTLFGAVMRTAAPVIANDPAHDPRSGGLPPGHPPLEAFLGVPFMHGEDMVGMIGLANRPGGYDEDDVAELQPLLAALGEVVAARRAEVARRAAEAELLRHRDHLTELVAEQTADLIATKDAAEAANQAKSQFLANMSHELRTPLHAVLSFARLGRSRIGKVGEDKLSDWFERIATSAERLLALLNDLLDLSKLEAGQMSVEPRAADLGAIVREVLGEYEAWLAAKRLNCEVRQPPGLPLSFVDALRIGQVLRNLLSNAIKFTPEGRSLRIALSPGWLHGHGGAERAAVELAVADEGIGIPEDELESVFDKFVQSSKTRTGAGGTGLGLAICREIVAAHGGVIFARNIHTGGAEFVVRLPACSELEHEVF